MVIKCEICGQEMEVIGEVDDGQTVPCPYCGKEFVYRKPSRIELPTGPVRPRKPAASEDDVPELPSEERKPKLGIRRPQTPQGTSPEASRANDLVRQVEARAQAEAQKARTKRIKAQVNNIIALLVLAGIGFAGYKGWRIWKGDETVELPPSVENIVEKLTPADAAAEQEAAAAKRAAEDAARAEAERQRELERKRQREAKEAEEAEKRAEEKKRLEEFFAVRNGFAGARLAYWSELPKEQRPGACEGSFGLVIPRGRGRCEYFQIASRTDEMTIKRLSDKVPPQEISQSEYEKLMTEHGGFFLKDGTAYFVTASGNKKIWTAPTNRGESFSPAKCVFGDAYPILGERLIETVGRGFEVYFAVDDKAEPIKVKSVKFEDVIDYETFEKIARDIVVRLKRRGEPPSLKLKKTKRTVVFYDGSHIAKGMNGVTKIPRKRPTNRTDSRRLWEEWYRLRDIALQEEREIQRKHDEARRKRAEWQAKINEPPSAFEIRRVLCAGVITIKRK